MSVRNKIIVSAVLKLPGEHSLDSMHREFDSPEEAKELLDTLSAVIRGWPKGYRTIVYER